MSRRDPQGLGYDPAVLRTLVDAYGRMLRELNVMRRESQDVAELLAIAAVTDECVSKQSSAQRRLDRVEVQRRQPSVPGGTGGAAALRVGGP